MIYRGLLVVGLIGALLIPATLGAAAAGNSSTNTTTTVDSGGNTTYVAAIDSSTRIVDYRYVGGTMTVTVEADRPRLLVLSDLGGAVAPEGGAAKIATKRISVSSGRSKVSLAADEWDGRAAVSIATSRGAVGLTAGSSDPLLSGPFDPDEARVIGLTGLLSGFSLVGMLYIQRRFRNEDRERVL